MPKILKIKNANDYSRYVGLKDKHPLVSVVEYADVSPVRSSLNNYEVYALFMLRYIDVELKYGCGRYDYRGGTLICVAPGQIGGKEDEGGLIELDGWALMFHPDLLHGTHLEKFIRDCTFFDYHINEALHMTDEECNVFDTLMRQLKDELDKKHDDFQNRIIVEYIGLILNYCMRFYNRQFLTRKPENTDVLMKFSTLLRGYFEEGRQLTDGLPTVQYFADKLCMSPNYFSDLVRKTINDTASNYIRQYIIQQIKNELATGANVAEVAYKLGFEYPQHLSRMFKKQTGMTPSEYVGSIRHE